MMRGALGGPFLVPVERCRSAEGECGRWRGAVRVAGSGEGRRGEGGGRGGREGGGKGEGLLPLCISLRSHMGN